MAIKIGYVSDLSVDSEIVRNFYAINWKRQIALSEKFFTNGNSLLDQIVKTKIIVLSLTMIKNRKY